MSKRTYPLKLPASVKKAAVELAASDGVSLNQFIAAAVAPRRSDACAPHGSFCTSARGRRSRKTCSDTSAALRRYRRPLRTSFSDERGWRHKIWHFQKLKLHA